MSVMWLNWHVIIKYQIYLEQVKQYYFQTVQWLLASVMMWIHLVRDCQLNYRPAINIQTNNLCHLCQQMKSILCNRFGWRSNRDNAISLNCAWHNTLWCNNSSRSNLSKLNLASSSHGLCETIQSRGKGCHIVNQKNIQIHSLQVHEICATNY